MPEQPNKPGTDDRKTPRADDEQAVKNQSSVTPDDYKGDPTRASGEKSFGEADPADGR